MGDCLHWGLSEKRVGLERTLGLGSYAVALAALTLAAGKLAGLLDTSWTPVAVAAVAAALLLAATRYVGVLIVHADCFLMRDHDVTQQPAHLQSTSSLLLQEAAAFVSRWVARGLQGQGLCRVGSR